LSELESENRKMNLELEEYRTEATHLKNQQATIRRLEERNRQLEQQVSVNGRIILLTVLTLFSPKIQLSVIYVKAQGLLYVCLVLCISSPSDILDSGN